MKSGGNIAGVFLGYIPDSPPFLQERCDDPSGARIAETHLSFRKKDERYKSGWSSCTTYQVVAPQNNNRTYTIQVGSINIRFPFNAYAQALATDGENVYVQFQQIMDCGDGNYGCAFSERFFGKVVIDRQEGKGWITLLPFRSVPILMGRALTNFSAREFVVEGGELFIKGVLTESGGRPAQIPLRSSP